MNIADIKGLKYPDEYFIKFFFKFNLHQKKDDTYVELGCSNGCNLMLPYQFNNNVVGVDLDKTLIGYAKENFTSEKSKNSFSFFNQDMREFAKEKKNFQTDVLVLANSIYYIPKNDFIELLNDLNTNFNLGKNIPFFIRFRKPDDFRNNKGKIIDKNSIIIQNGITGEDGAFCKFYETQELIQILQKMLNLHDFEIMHLKYDNIQNNIKVTSSEAVIWGYIN